MRQMAELIYKDRFPGIEMVLRTSSGIQRYPADADLSRPPRDGTRFPGITIREGKFYAWSHEKLPDGDFTVIAPLSQ